jgi:hypothetical protein
MMKILRLVVMIMALTALPVQGQLEFSGGMNLSELSGALGGAGLDNAANRAGMVFGFDLILPVGGMGLGLGADWSQKGVEGIFTDPDTQQEVLRAIDLQYIQVPLHIRVPVISAGPTTVNLVLGPTFGFRIGCDVTEGTGAIQKCGQLADGPDLKKTAIGGTAGLGLSFALGGIVYAGFDVRYTTGMTSINNISTDALKDRTLSLETHLGFSFF